MLACSRTGRTAFSAGEQCSSRKPASLRTHLTQLPRCCKCSRPQHICAASLDSSSNGPRTSRTVVDVLEVPASEVQRNASFALPLNGAGAQAPQQVAAAAAAGAPPLLDLGTPEGSALVEAAGAVWLTQLMKRLWPFIARAAEEAVTHVLLPKTLAEGMPPWMRDMKVEKLEIGDQAPTFTYVRVEPPTPQSQAAPRMVVGYKWQSRTDMLFHIFFLETEHAHLPEAVKKIIGTIASVKTGFKDMYAEGELLMTLQPLKAAWPVVRAVQVSMLGPPTLTFKATVGPPVGSEGAALPGLEQLMNPFMKDTQLKMMEPVLVPEHVTVPIELGWVPDVQKPEGVLQLQVLELHGLPERHSFQSQPKLYIEARVRNRVRAKLKAPGYEPHDEDEDEEEEATGGPGTTDPGLPTSTALCIHYKQHQSLVLDIWQQDQALLGSSRTRVGTAHLPLHLLDTSAPRDQVFDVKVELASDTPKGKVKSAAGAAAAAVSTVLAEAPVASSVGKVDPEEGGTVVRVATRYTSCGVAGDHSLGGSGVLAVQLKQVKLLDGSPESLRAHVYLRGPAAVPTAAVQTSGTIYMGRQSASSSAEIGAAAVAATTGAAVPISPLEQETVMAVAESVTQAPCVSQPGQGGEQLLMDSLYDVIGSQKDVEATTLVIEIGDRIDSKGRRKHKSSSSSSKAPEIFHRLEVPLPEILKVPTVATPGLAGAEFAIHDDDFKCTIRASIVFNPITPEGVPDLVASTAGPPDIAGQAKIVWSPPN